MNLSKEFWDNEPTKETSKEEPTKETPKETPKETQRPPNLYTKKSSKRGRPPSPDKRTWLERKKEYNKLYHAKVKERLEAFKLKQQNGKLNRESNNEKKRIKYAEQKENKETNINQNKSA